ncbi:hypothetical protein [Pseudomonas sp. Irchel 3A5]|nr:hypothetical protein [Pseudomonas sp. Irchel 3A5]
MRDKQKSAIYCLSMEERMMFTHRLHDRYKSLVDRYADSKKSAQRSRPW